MITIKAILTNNLTFTSISAEPLNQFSNAKLVVYLPALATDTFVYTWVTPSNLKMSERLLSRDAAEEVGDYEGLFAYSSQIYPGMTLGLTAQQDTGTALFRVRIGNILSPIAKVTVLKSLSPEDTEMPPSELAAIAELNERVDNIEDELQGDFVRVGFEDGDYQELTDLNAPDLIYVERNGIQSYITADGMIGPIERNVTTLTYETAVETTIANPTAYARTWFFPIEELQNNPVDIENAEYELMNLQQNEEPEVNMFSMNVEDDNPEQEVGFSDEEVQVASLGVEPDNEQEPGFIDSEVQVASLGVEQENEQEPGFMEEEVMTASIGVDNELEQEPGFMEEEIQTQSLYVENENEQQPGQMDNELSINPLGIGDPHREV